MKKSIQALGIAAMTIASAGMAHATIFVGNTPSVTGSGPYTWNYSINGDGIETLISGTTFFTVYDFSGYVAGSITAPAGWTATAQLLGMTPSQQLVTDSPSLYNLTFTYTGGGSGLVPTLSGFSAQSLYGTVIANSGTYTYLTGNGSGATDQGQGHTAVPVAPEPMTMSLLGGGLAVLGLLRFRRN